jgi:hypothetical protein
MLQRWPYSKSHDLFREISVLEDRQLVQELLAGPASVNQYRKSNIELSKIQHA